MSEFDERRRQQIFDAFLAAYDDMDFSSDKILAAVAKDIPDVTMHEIAAALAAYAKQLQTEAEGFQRWTDEQRKLGRPEAELIFGNCVREVGWLKQH